MLPLEAEMGRVPALAIVVCLLLPPRTPAQQVERFEIGQRLREFEAAWDLYPQSAARQRAVPPLQRAVKAFFAFRMDEVASSLDQALYALRSEQPPDSAERWARSLYLRLDTHLIGEAERGVGFTLSPLYKEPGQVPGDARLVLVNKKHQNPGVAPFVTKIQAFPLAGKIPPALVGTGDATLGVEIWVNGTKRLARERTVSSVPQLESRLGKLRRAMGALPKDPPDTERESIRGLVRLLEGMSQKRIPETSYPSAHLLEEAENAARDLTAGKIHLGQKRAGQFWLTVVAGASLVPVRLFVPDAVRKGEALPLVVALHGAGGSENLFFEAYGRGEILRLCEQRGWLLVAPRSAGFAKSPPLPDLVAELGRLYPVDKKRVFLVGHSMGAAQAVLAAQQAPDRFAAVAALGGGGILNRPQAVRAIPFLIGVGTEDFALRGAQSLRDGLKGAGVQLVQYREYPDVEHLMIVQTALPDVFSFLDKIASP